MANNQNYKTDIQTVSSGYQKYMVSRVVNNPVDALIEVQIPTSVPQDFTVELHLYSLADNSLVYNTVVSTDTAGLFEIKRLTYLDGTTRNLLFIDFSKSDVTLYDGRYELVLNFFVPEFGTPYTAPLYITDISPSRKEVELKLLPEYDVPISSSKLSDFVSPQISMEWIPSVMRQIFNQPSTMTSDDVPTDKTNLTFNIIEQFLPEETSTLLNDPNTSGEFTSSVKNVTQHILDIAYGLATQSMATYENVTYTDDRIYLLVSQSIVTAIDSVKTTPPSQFNIL